MKKTHKAIRAFLALIATILTISFSGCGKWEPPSGYRFLYKAVDTKYLELNDSPELGRHYLVKLYCRIFDLESMAERDERFVLPVAFMEPSVAGDFAANMKEKFFILPDPTKVESSGDKVILEGKVYKEITYKDFDSIMVLAAKAPVRDGKQKFSEIESVYKEKPKE